jgi:hypothetical protein
VTRLSFVSLVGLLFNGRLGHLKSCQRALPKGGECWLEEGLTLVWMGMPIGYKGLKLIFCGMGF